MKIHKNNNNFTFKAGLTKSMQAEILRCDTKKIENYFARRNIESDFQNSKVVAWCSLKCLQILETLNKKFCLNLEYPKGIFVEDFRNLNSSQDDAMGFTNFAPAFLHKNKNILVPEKTIFFNASSINWENIDNIADECYEKNISTTNFFLEQILHEFMHVLHENNMLKKIGGTKMIKILQDLLNQEVLNEFLHKHAKSLSHICDYAASHPLEAVACDLAKREIASLDKETLLPVSNIFNKKPYNKKIFLTKNKDNSIEKLIRKYWNGNLLV